MEVKTIKEEPLIILRGGNGYEDQSYDNDIEVYAGQLKNAVVGMVFSTNHGGVLRDSIEESLEIVYKTSKGVAGLLRSYEGTDEPTPKVEESVQLIWFELA